MVSVKCVQDHRFESCGDFGGIIAKPSRRLEDGFHFQVNSLKFCQNSREFNSGNRKSVYSVPLTAVEAEESTNALAKSIYAKLFGWILDK